jgi:hypothetical protein
VHSYNPSIQEVKEDEFKASLGKVSKTLSQKQKSWVAYLAFWTLGLIPRTENESYYEKE